MQHKSLKLNKVYINDDPGLTLTYFRSNLVAYAFEWGTRSSMILQLGMDHQGLKVYRVYVNDDLGLTLTYLTVTSSLVKFAYCAYTRPIVR